MRFRVLGPLQVEGEGDASLGGPKEQAVLAQLIAHVNTAVPASSLIFGLWGDTPPATAQRTLQAYITRLRRVVEPSRGRPRVIVTAADGWLLRVEPDNVDAGRFEVLVREGRAALAAGRAGEATDIFTSGLGLWRGAAYAGFDDLPGCRTEAVRLGELRLLAQDERLAALLVAGDAPQVAAEAQALLADEPLRESRWALLIRAQYAAGRQADALAALARAREVLRDELGTDPGPELRRLQKAILAQDPALVATAGPSPPDLPEVLGRAGPRMVGREAELDRLVAVWAAARTGVGGALLVEGPAGIGKSRLVAELTQYASAQNAIVRHATADPAQTAPCAALREVLTGGPAPFSITSDHGELAAADLAARLASGGFLAVVGSSGSGKSSLVRAGLVPALQAGGRGLVDIRTPLDASKVDEATQLLVVDQLEEVFAEGSSAQVDEVATDIVAASRRGTAIVTLRSDFFADAAAHPALGPLLESGTALLGPMRLDDLRRAIIEPAASVGLDVADDLVEAVVQEVAGEPGALPLLSVALLETYRWRDGSVLRLNTYQATGGLTGALARLAEQTYDGLSQPQRRATRRVLTRLADEDHGRLVRRRAPIAEICPPGDTDAAGAIEAMARRRLLVVADDTVEVAHEALLAAWPRYQAWLAEDSAGRQIRSQVTAGAVAWDAAGRADTDLYRGVRLGVAAEWEDGHVDEVTDLEREFLARSRAAAERERLDAEAHAALRERQARRLRLALIAVASLLSLSLVAGVLAVLSADRARTAATAAIAARLGALALTEPRVDLSALLAAQAVTLHPSAETRSDLLATVLRRPEVRRATVPTGWLVGGSPRTSGVVSCQSWITRQPASQSSGLAATAARS